MKLKHPFLGEIFEGKASDHFEKKVRGRTFLHLKGKATRFHKILTLRRFEAFLNEHHALLAPPVFRMALEGRILPERSYCASRPNRTTHDHLVLVPERVSEWLGKGATAIIQRMEDFIPAVAALADEIRALTCERVQINGYYSPGGASGFQQHFDTHDVLAIQVGGHKAWTLSGICYPDPLESDDYTQHQPPDNCAKSITLMAGDMLYIPRGYWHSAKADAGPSLHLTIGIYHQTRLDVFEMLRSELAKMPALRKDLFMAGSSLEDSCETIKQACNKLLADPLFQQRIKDNRDRFQKPTRCAKHFKLQAGALKPKLPSQP